MVTEVLGVYETKFEFALNFDKKNENKEVLSKIVKSNKK